MPNLFPTIKDFWWPGSNTSAWYCASNPLSNGNYTGLCARASTPSHKNSMLLTQYTPTLFKWSMTSDIRHNMNLNGWWLGIFLLTSFLNCSNRTRPSHLMKENLLVCLLFLSLIEGLVLSNACSFCYDLNHCASDCDLLNMGIFKRQIKSKT